MGALKTFVAAAQNAGSAAMATLRRGNGAGRAVVKVSSQQEIGASGTDINTGVISDDYNTKMQFPQSVDNFEQMRKGDAQVKSALSAIKLPIQTANWVLMMDEEGDPAHKEFIEEALWHDLEIPFDSFLSEALCHVDFGFYYFEKVFKVRPDGMITWRKFAPRIPSAHLYWKTDQGKGSGKNRDEGVTQQLKGTDFQGRTITDTQPQIPMSKLLLFVHDKEGDNFEGVSALRPAYKHWVMKELAYKIQMISNERYGVGVPIMTLTKNANDNDLDKAEEILKNLRSNEKSYIVLKEGWSFEIKAPTASAKDASLKDCIEHHNRMILMSVLAPFLDLGSGSTGSWALGETQMNFFLNSLAKVAKNMADVLNKAIEELIKINFGEQEYYPYLRATEIGNIDKTVLMSALAAGIGSGAIIVDERLRDFVRENLNLPEEDKEEIEMQKENEAAKNQPEEALSAASQTASVDELEKDLNSEIESLKSELSEIIK